MTKKIILAVVIAAVVFALYYFVPFPKTMDFQLDGFIRNTKGETIAPCSVEFSGGMQRYLIKKENILEGTLQFSDGTQTYTYTFDTLVTPYRLRDLNYAYGYRYDEHNNSVSCKLYFTDDLSTYVVLDGGTAYCISTLEESKFLNIYEVIAQTNSISN